LTSREQESSSTTNSNERQTGIVKRWVFWIKSISFILLNHFRWIPDKGYGFVQRNNGGSDVFVHLRELTDGSTSLEEGQVVEFDIKTNEKGDMAQNVIVRNET